MGQRHTDNRLLTVKTGNMSNTKIKLGQKYRCPFAPTKRVEVVGITGAAAACKIIHNPNRSLSRHHKQYLNTVMLVPLQVLENANP